MFKHGFGANSRIKRKGIPLMRGWNWIWNDARHRIRV